jgi:hypothetical protein
VSNGFLLHTMPWTQKPKSFADFVYDAEGLPPILIYKAVDLPKDISWLARGDICRDEHDAWETENREKYYRGETNQYGTSYTCQFGDNCLYDTSAFDVCVSNPEYYLVVPEYMKEELEGNRLYWLSTSHYNNHITADWIYVSDEVAKELTETHEPFAAIWSYYKGPRQWCQHGGDEDWTAVVRKSVYLHPPEYQDYDDSEIWDHDELHFKAYLDCCGTSYEDEEDFRVFTGAHA